MTVKFNDSTSDTLLVDMQDTPAAVLKAIASKRNIPLQQIEDYMLVTSEATLQEEFKMSAYNIKDGVRHDYIIKYNTSRVL
jgi:hypothetical protein